jgi:hypothetical protein
VQKYTLPPMLRLLIEENNGARNPKEDEAARLFVGDESALRIFW